MVTWSCIYKSGLIHLSRQVIQTIKTGYLLQMTQKHTKGWSTSLISIAMQIKSTMRYYLTQFRIGINKKFRNNKYWRGCGEKRALLHCSWQCKLVKPLWGTWRFPKKLKTELPYNPAILVLDICMEKTIIQKYTYTPMFIATLFTIVRTWKQPKCPLTEEWMKKVVHVYNGILLSHKKEQNNTICSNMDGPRYSHTEWSKSEKEISCDITYLWTLKKWYR